MREKKRERRKEYSKCERTRERKMVGRRDMLFLADPTLDLVCVCRAGRLVSK